MERSLVGKTSVEEGVPWMVQLKSPPADTLWELSKHKISLHFLGTFQGWMQLTGTSGIWVVPSVLTGVGVKWP